MGAKKKLDRRYIEFFARELRTLVADRFGGNQTSAARALGCSQPHLSHLMAADSARGPGLHVLILMREFTDRSIDELLGLSSSGSQAIAQRLEASLEMEMARFRANAQKRIDEATDIALTRAGVAKEVRAEIVPRKRSTKRAAAK